jgi:YcaO-like protein with predicted kinase domain
MIPDLPTISHPPIVKTFRGGTHRTISPEATLDRVRPFLSKMGITRIANVTGLDLIGIPVTMVCRPNSRSLAVSQGKGLDLSAAKASGVMEAIELYHAEHVTLPLKIGSYEEIQRSHQVINVNQLASIVGSRFHPHLPLLWIEGQDLLQNQNVWLPYETVHLNSTYPDPTGSGCFASSSNGLSSGNHLLEAISHGIFEIVERDATTLWHLLDSIKQSQTRIDLSTIEDMDCCDLLDRCNRAGIDVVIWDMTSDVGIPVFQCLLMERTDEPSRLLYSATGMGCHLTRSIALLRAITEAAQSRLTLIAGSRDDVFREEYEEEFRSIEYLRSQRQLMSVKSPMRHFHQVPTWNAETFNEDIALALDYLRTIQITSVVSVNLTKPEFNLPVVRIVIPGLESFVKSPGYRPGQRAQQLLEASSI